MDGVGSEGSAARTVNPEDHRARTLGRSRRLDNSSESARAPTVALPDGELRESPEVRTPHA